jgi:hypothetical protein
MFVLDCQMNKPALINNYVYARLECSGMGLALNARNKKKYLEKEHLNNYKDCRDPCLGLNLSSMSTYAQSIS